MEVALILPHKKNLAKIDEVFVIPLGTYFPFNVPILLGFQGCKNGQVKHRVKQVVRIPAEPEPRIPTFKFYSF